MRLRTTGLVLLALVLAAPAWALTISGRILKGEELTPVNNVTVQIHVVRGNEELPGGTTRTDTKGQFKFTGLQAQPDLSYYVATEYQGAFYSEGPLQAAGEELQRDVTVYDVGSDISSVSVSNHHVIVEHQQDGLHVTEILIFQNSGKTAFLGVGSEHAESAGMRIGLPASVKKYEPGMGADEQTTVLKGRDLSSLRPIPPGMHPFSFTYVVPLSAHVDFSHRFYYPTGSFEVMFDDPSLKLESKQLQYAGSRQQGGKKYEMYTGSGFGVGQEASVRIVGASIWTSPILYGWMAAVLAIIAVLYVALRRGRRAQAIADAARGAEAHEHLAPVVAPPAPAAAKSSAPATSPPPHRPDGAPDEFATAYLCLISALDQANARGELSKDAYTLIRTNLKRKLEVVLSNGATRAHP
jgi:hypothetical protein